MSLHLLIWGLPHPCSLAAKIQADFHRSPDAPHAGAVSPFDSPRGREPLRTCNFRFSPRGLWAAFCFLVWELTARKHMFFHILTVTVPDVGCSNKYLPNSQMEACYHLGVFIPERPWVIHSVGPFPGQFFQAALSPWRALLEKSVQYVGVSWGCRNKSPQTEWLKTTLIYSLAVRKVRSPKPISRG